MTSSSFYIRVLMSKPLVVCDARTQQVEVRTASRTSHQHRVVFYWCHESFHIYCIYIFNTNIYTFIFHTLLFRNNSATTTHNRISINVQRWYIPTDLKKKENNKYPTKYTPVPRSEANQWNRRYHPYCV